MVDDGRLALGVGEQVRGEDAVAVCVDLVADQAVVQGQEARVAESGEWVGGVAGFRDRCQVGRVGGVPDHGFDAAEPVESASFWVGVPAAQVLVVQWVGGGELGEGAVAEERFAFFVLFWSLI